MTTPRKTFLERTYSRESADLGYDDADESDDRDATPAVVTGVPDSTVSSKSTTIGGERVDLAEPQTPITFEDDNHILSGEYGQPRPIDFFHARQLGQTPQMQLIKNVVIQQLSGGEIRTYNEDGEDPSGPMADFAALVEDVYQGPHFQEKTLDNLIADAVNDLVDTAWAYHEILPSDGGDFRVAGFKPLPPLQVMHNIDEDTGQLESDPAFYHAPHKSAGGHVRITVSEPAELAREDVVVMRDPHSSRSDKLYGESIATRVREWLELITDVDVHQKRHYADSHLPAGFLHFMGAVGEDKLEAVEQDIQEVAGDPQEMVVTTSEEQASWIPIGGEVADLEAIQQQQWYFKLVLAAVGLNQSEINIVESSGFAKETPELQRMIFKKVTKPFMSAIFDPHNDEAVDLLAEDVGIDDVPFRVGIERFDPVREQIERDQTIDEWNNRMVSLNEVRGAIGRDAVDIPIELEDVETDADGETVNVADLPRYVVDLLLDDSPSIDLGELADGMGSEGS